MFSFFAFSGFRGRTFFGGFPGGSFRFFVLPSFDRFFGDLFAAFDQPGGGRTYGVCACIGSAQSQNEKRNQPADQNPHVRIQADCGVTWKSRLSLPRACSAGSSATRLR
jgi:hypothetical protein